MARHLNVTGSAGTDPTVLSPMGPSVESLADLLAEKQVFIWDFDGSLCDTEPLHFAAYAVAFGEIGHQVRESEYYQRFTQTNQGIALEVQAYGLAVDEQGRRAIRVRKVQEYERLIASGVARPFAEVPEILTLSLDLGKTWSIASNSPESENRQVLEQLGGVFLTHSHLLGPARGGAEGLRKKPAPDLFVEAVRLAGVAPQSCLVIEDTDKGLMAAQDAGVDAICLATRYNHGLTLSARHLARPTHSELLGALQVLRRRQEDRARVDG